MTTLNFMVKQEIDMNNRDLKIKVRHLP